MRERPGPGREVGCAGLPHSMAMRRAACFLIVMVGPRPSVGELVILRPTSRQRCLMLRHLRVVTARVGASGNPTGDRGESATK